MYEAHTDVWGKSIECIKDYMKSLRGALDLAIKRAVEHVGKNPIKTIADSKTCNSPRDDGESLAGVHHKTLFPPFVFPIESTHHLSLLVLHSGPRAAGVCPCCLGWSLSCIV